jgi:hypothetical protein
MLQFPYVRHATRIRLVLVRRDGLSRTACRDYTYDRLNRLTRAEQKGNFRPAHRPSVTPALHLIYDDNGIDRIALPNYHSYGEKPSRVWQLISISLILVLRLTARFENS